MDDRDFERLKRALTSGDEDIRAEALNEIRERAYLDERDPSKVLELFQIDLDANQVEVKHTAAFEPWLNRCAEPPDLPPRFETHALRVIRDATDGPTWRPIIYTIASYFDGAPPALRERLLAAMLATPREPIDELPEIGRRLGSRSGTCSGAAGLAGRDRTIDGARPVRRRPP